MPFTERTLRRKVQEAMMALLVEARYDKDEILERYLNLAPYGGNIEGVAAAARISRTGTRMLLGVRVTPSKRVV